MITTRIKSLFAPKSALDLIRNCYFLSEERILYIIRKNKTPFEPLTVFQDDRISVSKKSDLQRLLDRLCDKGYLTTDHLKYELTNKARRRFRLDLAVMLLCEIIIGAGF